MPLQQQALDLINLKREHVKRLANQKGAAGEAKVLATNIHYVARPKGRKLGTLKAPSGNTSQSQYSPYNLQIPQEYCGRMPSIAGRAPTDCVPRRPHRGWLSGWLFG